MKFSLKSGRSTKSNHNNIFPEGIQHPDLPLSPNPQASSTPRTENPGINRSSSLSERFTPGYARDRRSLAVDPGYDPSLQYRPDELAQEPAQLSGGLTRSQTVLRSEATRKGDNLSPEPSPLLGPDTGRRITTPPDQAEPRQEYSVEGGAPMNYFLSNTSGKTSSDSGQSSFADRFTQRRLQRLNTEQSFREQRQGGHSIYSPPTSLSEQSGYKPSGVSYTPPETSAQQYNTQNQPHPSSQQPAYQGERTFPTGANAAATIQAQPITSIPRTNNFSRTDAAPPNAVPSSQHSPTDLTLQNISQENIRPPISQSSRSYSHQQQLQQQFQQQGGAAAAEESSMSGVPNAGLSASSKAARLGAPNRQSIHNGINMRDGPSPGAPGQQPPGQPHVFAPPPGAQLQSYPSNASQPQLGDVGRKTPQPLQTSEDMTDEEINQLIKDHKELREKYTKVKKYYFEKEDQVKQLQNSLAHQRLSQSRTSLDDSEYTTRFNRLEGLVAQLAFSIRKSWRSVPSWLVGSVNKDAIATGKQEMTAAGRAFISYWLVEEVFNKYFHPDIDPALSAQLRMIQRNMRLFAPPAQTAEEEEYLTSKVVNWRLATLEGLQEALRSKECAAHRAQLTEMLKEHLISSLSVHLQEPTPPDLEGGVHMIIELVVSIAIHLPLESRDVVIEYFFPGSSILHDQMKLDTGIPPLMVSIADDQVERTSIKSADSETADAAETSSHEQSSKKRGMLAHFTGSSKAKSERSGSGGEQQQQRKHAGAGGSSSSLNRPDSSQGMRQDHLPKVRMAAGIGVSIRGRSVLVRAPVFATS